MNKAKKWPSGNHVFANNCTLLLKKAELKSHPYSKILITLGTAKFIRTTRNTCFRDIHSQQNNFSLIYYVQQKNFQKI